MIDSLRTPELEAFLDGLPGDRQQNMLRYEAILDRGGPDSALVHMVEASLRAPDDGNMPESDKTAAFARLFTTIHAATHESLDQVQAHTDRLWGRLSNDEKRQIALNPSAAATIAIDAMRNDPLLAARVTPTASDTPRGIEAYQGGAALGFMGGHFAALRGQDAARAAEARQFADLGISRADAATFSSIGMDRMLFDRYLREGFTQAQITAAARDANVLGFRGREDIDIAMRAPAGLRAAAAHLAALRNDPNATPEQIAAAQRAYDDAQKKYGDQPGAADFIRRLDQQNLQQVREVGPNAALGISDQAVAANVAAIGTADRDQLQAGIAARNSKAIAAQPDEQRIEAALADFGLDPVPAQQAAVQQNSTPDAAVTADATPAEGDASRTADATGVTPAAATVIGDANPAGTTPAADSRTRVARAPVRLPTATV